MTTFDVSAEMGGIDADQAILPHFFALKAALKGRSFEGFPFPELSFILRVDGEVNAYGLSGPGNVDFDRKRQWVSIDIGITMAHWAGRDASQVAGFIGEAIMGSIDVLKDCGGRRLAGTDWVSLENALRAFCAAYVQALQ